MSTKKLFLTLALGVYGCLLRGQTFAGSGLTRAEEMLEQVYVSILDRADIFIDIASFIGILGALVMIFSHVYTRLLRGKAVHLGALLRPFVILIALLIYVPLLNTVNTIMRPTVTLTKDLVSDENAVLEDVMDRMSQVEADRGFGAYFGDGPAADFQKYLEAYGLEDEDGWFGEDRIGQYIQWQAENLMYNFRLLFRISIFWLLSLAYTAVVFALNAIRTFTLAILALVGPLALGFSLWPPFARSFIGWLGRYITVYLWLPVANILGFLISSVMVQFNQVHVDAVTDTGSVLAFSELDVLYIILLITGIMGYLAVPTITGYIISASGASALLGGAGSVAVSAGSAAAAGASAVASGGASVAATAGGKLAGGVGSVGSWLGGQFRGGGGSGGGDVPALPPPKVAGSRPSRSPGQA